MNYIMEKMYKVFEMDKCWDEYASDEVLIGAESVEDLLNHIKDIYPDDIHTVHREDWMDDEDWGEECEYGEYKEGDIITEEYFSKSQIEDLRESLDPDCAWPRIKEIPHLYTDTPYEPLHGFGYME